MPFPPERPPPACLAVTQDSPGASRGTAAGGALVALIACGCAFGPQRAPSPAPVVNAAVASSTPPDEYLLLVQALVEGKPSQQAGVVGKPQPGFRHPPTPHPQREAAPG